MSVVKGVKCSYGTMSCAVKYLLEVYRRGKDLNSLSSSKGFINVEGSLSVKMWLTRDVAWTAVRKESSPHPVMYNSCLD